MEAQKFNAIFTSLADRLFRLAKSILRNDEDAKDALQDVQMKLWEKRDELSEVENMTAFTMRTIRNICLDMIRKRHETGELNPETETFNPNPHQQTELKNMSERIKKLMEELPELQRSIIRMRDVEEMDTGEIAYAMEMTENAVTVNLSRARQKIRVQILNELQLEEKTTWKE